MVISELWPATLVERMPNKKVGRANKTTSITNESQCYSAKPSCESNTGRKLWVLREENIHTERQDRVAYNEIRPFLMWFLTSQN
jgi:hypothetical protein